MTLASLANVSEDTCKGANANRAATNAFAANVLPAMPQIEVCGMKGDRSLAEVLNASSN